MFSYLKDSLCRKFLEGNMDLFGCVWLLLSLTYFSTAEETYCPTPHIDTSCTCIHGAFPGGFGTKVICSDIKNPSVLLKEIQNFRGYKIDFLILTNLQLPYLPAGLFLGTSVRELIIKDSLLDNLYSTTNYSPSPFAGLEDSLEEFAVYSTKEPAKWYTPDLSGFKLLKRVEIVLSPTNFVGHVFAEIGGGSLESLTVAYSNIHRIHPQAFPELTGLKNVNFRGNFLLYMVRTMFPDPAPKLEKIDLSDNKLFTLPENMFDNMPALKFLDLSQNEFKKFIDFRVYNSLRSFYIGRNPFDCGCHLLPLRAHLFVSKIRYNDIEKVKCIHPENHEETSLQDISFEDFNCF